MESEKWIKMDGDIFGIALNYKYLYESLKPTFNEKPYVNAPIKSVLFIKTSNTRNIDQGQVIKPRNQTL